MHEEKRFLEAQGFNVVNVTSPSTNAGAKDYEFSVNIRASFEFEGLLMIVFLCGVGIYKLLQGRISRMKENLVNVILMKNHINA
jgi:hypothetical protein